MQNIKIMIQMSSGLAGIFKFCFCQHSFFKKKGIFIIWEWMWICYSEDLLEGDNFSIETLRQTEGTIILHLNFAISMDQELGREFIKFLKVRKMQIFFSFVCFYKTFEEMVPKNI